MLYLVFFFFSKVICFLVILFLVILEILLYCICCFSNLDLYLDVNVIVDDMSLFNFNVFLVIIKLIRLFILIFFFL